MVPKITDRLYKKVEQGEYTADHARKVFEKLQIEDTDGFLKKLERINHGAITNSLVKPENEETIKESVSKLSESEKEQVIRKYVRNKIAKILRENYIFEQEEAPEEEAPEADAPEADAPEADVETPDVDVDTPEETPATDDTPVFTGGGGTSSPSPSPTPDVTPTTDDSEASVDPTSKEIASKMKLSINKFVSDIKSKLINATPIEVAPDVVQPIKSLMKSMTAKKKTEFKKAIATAMRNADIKLPKPSPSDDYTENEA